VKLNLYRLSFSGRYDLQKALIPRLRFSGYPGMSVSIGVLPVARRVS
jgi:hypothetical protein